MRIHESRRFLAVLGWTAVLVLLLAPGAGAQMGGGGMGGGGMGGGSGTIEVLDATAGNTLQVRAVTKTMSDGQNLTFWVYCANTMGGMGNGCSLPGPIFEIGVGQTADINFSMHMAPMESSPYRGHTIHLHGLDVSQAEDGVPETGASVFGDNYTFSVDSRYVGSHMYHCHVHTVKHLEMGMYGAFVVRAVDGQGGYLNLVNDGGVTYDTEWIWVLSSVDPAYHASSATGDSMVFADYNPEYFLVNGQEGLTKTSPAETFTAAPGDKVIVRLIGIHSVNSTFEVKSSTGQAKSFVVYNADGFALPTPQTVTSVSISPGQTRDVVLTLPTSSGTWYPQVTYRDLRNDAPYPGGVVYTRLNF
jgi:FtsP/CotA-like multicopper oxidase with cupredoxin domain